MQVDLIDMKKKPSHGKKWIIHLVDGYTKFEWAAPLPDKKGTAYNTQIFNGSLFL